MVTTGMFGTLTSYSMTTLRSLAGRAELIFMGLIGVMLASLVGLFWHSDALQHAASRRHIRMPNWIHFVEFNCRRDATPAAGAARAELEDQQASSLHERDTEHWIRCIGGPSRRRPVLAARASRFKSPRASPHSSGAARRA